MNFKKYQASLNLYNAAETSWTSGVKDDNGNVTGSTTSHFTSNYTAVESGTKYSITGVYASGSSTAARIYYYDSSKAWISRTAALRDNPLVFETPNNCAYIQVQCANGADGTNFMLVKGEYTSETMPSFEPYGGVWNSIPYYIYGTETDAFTSYPVQLYTDGQPVSSYTLKGNTSTSGTPSPSNPITINGVGEKTANLFDVNAIGNIYPNPPTTTQRVGLVVNNLDTNNDYYLSINNPSQIQIFYARFDGETRLDTSALSTTGNVLIPMTGANAVRFWVSEGDSWSNITNIMLSKGSTAQNYEPYGYKISILKDSSPLTPIYLGDVQTTRKIVKFVLDGTEDWEYVTATNGYARLIIGTINQYMSNFILCTHLTQAQITTSTTDIGCNVSNPASKNASVVVLRLSGISPSVEAYKSFLAEQYAAGTPVTVWVVLTTAITSTVNEPLMKIDEYADSIDSTQAGVTIPTTGGTATIDVDTTVKPSEMSLTYHGWHEHEPLKRENGQWV